MSDTVMKPFRPLSNPLFQRYAEMRAGIIGAGYAARSSGVAAAITVSGVRAYGSVAGTNVAT